jgi:hypothetical protein
LIFMGALSSCRTAPAPYEDYALARTAVQAARDADSPRFAPGFWARADENFRLAEREYKDSDFEAAKLHFHMAQKFAEKAENATRLKKFKTGDSYP